MSKHDGLNPQETPQQQETTTAPIAGPELRLEGLPDIALGKIVSYLHWKEKEWLQLAIPSVEPILNSPLGWETFENDRCYAVQKLHMYIHSPLMVDHELDVISRHGQFFQSCTIWVHKIVAIGEERDNDLRLLRAVVQHCKQLKSLAIIHLADISVSKLKSLYTYYLKPLEEIAYARRSNFKLSLNRLFYSSIVNVKTGITDYLAYLNEKDVLQHLVCLDFSHGLILDGSGCSNQSPACLLNCVNIQTLKCPIQSINTTLVTRMFSRKLNNLYLVNDDHTQLISFVEKQFLDWNKICLDLSTNKKQQVAVHYIYKNRPILNEDIIPNPFTKSLVLDNLSSNISASMLHHIADLYGTTLINLAFCSNYWEFLMHFADLGQINESFRYVGSKCVQLRSFLSCLSLPSSALIALARNSLHVSTVRVYKENIRLATADKPEWRFAHKMALALDTPRWDMLKKGDNIFNIPNANCSLLFANCFNEF